MKTCKPKLKVVLNIRKLSNSDIRLLISNSLIQNRQQRGRERETNWKTSSLIGRVPDQNKDKDKDNDKDTNKDKDIDKDKDKGKHKDKEKQSERQIGRHQA